MIDTYEKPRLNSRDVIGNHDLAPDSYAYKYGLLPVSRTVITERVVAFLPDRHTVQDMQRRDVATIPTTTISDSETVTRYEWVGPEIEGYDPCEQLRIDRLTELAKTQSDAYYALKDMGIEVAK